MKKHQLYTGTSGLVLPVPNKSFYPDEFKDKSRLTYYSHLFNSIEINSSFYKLPRKQTVAKWAESVTENFKFTFKLWKEITHQKELVFDKEDINRFMEAISGVGDKKGSLLIQFPGKISVDYSDKIYEILENVYRSAYIKGWDIQVEFRHPTLYIREMYELLAEFNAGVVIHDLPGKSTPSFENRVNTIYLRFHGPEKNYRGTYTNDILLQYAERIKNWLKKEKTVYVYFNNTAGDAVQNLITLNKMLKQ